MEQVHFFLMSLMLLFHILATTIMCSIQMLVIMTGEEAELNLALDASSLDEGTHTLKMTFWNSFGGSVSDETSFWVTGPLEGDVNSDGQVGIGDIVAVTNYMAGNANGITLMKADVNGDGEVGIGDIVAITNIMAGSGK